MLSRKRVDELLFEIGHEAKRKSTIAEDAIRNHDAEQRKELDAVREQLGKIYLAAQCYYGDSKGETYIAEKDLPPVFKNARPFLKEPNDAD